MVSYGWTIDYISECVTVPQIAFLLAEIKARPPVSIMSFGMGSEATNSDEDEKMNSQLNKFGDKVKKVERWKDKPSVKSVIRLKDKVKLK